MISSFWPASEACGLTGIAKISVNVRMYDVDLAKKICKIINLILNVHLVYRKNEITFRGNTNDVTKGENIQESVASVFFSISK